MGCYATRDPQAVAAILDALGLEGLGGDKVVAIPQGFRLSSAVWGAERKLKEGNLRHCGANLMAWCVGNCVAEQRGNSVYISKQTAGKAKIDPVISMFNAIKLLEREPEAPREPAFQLFYV